MTVATTTTAARVTIPSSPPSITTVTRTTSERAARILSELLADNAAFVSGDSRPQCELSSADVRHDLAEHGQKPDVAIVACADSRVGPEVIFSSGVGRLFVIRNAGNIVTETSVLASLEYAVGNLDVPLIMVCGHSNCGAITAAVGAAKCNHNHSHEEEEKGKGKGTTALGRYVSTLADVVKPDVGSPEEVKDAILTNIRHGVKSLKFNAGPISKAYAAGTVDIVGALYDIRTGEVFVIDQ